MISTILIAHIIGAIFLGITASIAVYDIWKARVCELPRRARVLSVGLFFELASGSVLSVLSPGSSLLAYCQNIGAYCFVVFGIFALIYMKLLKVGGRELFPVRFVMWNTMGACLVTIPVFAQFILS